MSTPITFIGEYPPSSGFALFCYIGPNQIINLMPATPATNNITLVCMQASPVCNEVNMELTSAQDTKCTVYFMEGVLCNMLKVFKICSCTCHTQSLPLIHAYSFYRLRTTLSTRLFVI